VKFYLLERFFFDFLESDSSLLQLFWNFLFHIFWFISSDIQDFTRKIRLSFEKKSFQPASDFFLASSRKSFPALSLKYSPEQSFERTLVFEFHISSFSMKIFEKTLTNSAHLKIDYNFPISDLSKYNKSLHNRHFFPIPISPSHHVRFSKIRLKTEQKKNLLQ